MGLFSMALPDSGSYEVRILLYASNVNEQIGFDNLQIAAMPKPKNPLV